MNKNKKFKAIIRIKSPYFFIEVDGKLIGRISDNAKKIVEDGETVDVAWWGLHGTNTMGVFLDWCNHRQAYLSCAHKKTEPKFKEESLFGIHLTKKEYIEKKRHLLCDICAHSNIKTRLYFVYCNKCNQPH